jgi:regulator of protease activity HflC (stomatin/prohibitin superfamily)
MIMQRTLVIGGVIAAFVLLLLANSLYIVPVDQQAIVVRFGQAQYTVNANQAGATESGPMYNAPAGLHLKLPLFDDVRFYDKRNLGYDLEADEIIASDQQRLNVDAIARWRIMNPLQFFRAAQSEDNGRYQLGTRFTSALRRRARQGLAAGYHLGPAYRPHAARTRHAAGGSHDARHRDHRRAYPQGRPAAGELRARL